MGRQSRDEEITALKERLALAEKVVKAARDDYEYRTYSTLEKLRKVMDAYDNFMKERE
jgi:hypothetical protein